MITYLIDWFSYESVFTNFLLLLVFVDIRELISLEDVMEELGLGPNGGLLYCMEYPFFFFFFPFSWLWFLCLVLLDKKRVSFRFTGMRTCFCLMTLIFVIRHLEANLDDWLTEELDNYLDDDYLVFDCPGRYYLTCELMFVFIYLLQILK